MVKRPRNTEICPVCNGTGIVEKEYTDYDTDQILIERQGCWHCGTKGWTRKEKE